MGDELVDLVLLLRLKYETIDDDDGRKFGTRTADKHFYCLHAPQKRVWSRGGNRMADDEEDEDEDEDPIVRLFISAANGGRVQEVRQLLDEGVDIESSCRGMRALHYASIRGEREVITLLISRGAIIDSLDWARWTPLLRACCESNLEIVELLYASGANIHHVGADGDECTALFLAASFDCLALCEFLVSKGADVMKESRYGVNALSGYGDFLKTPLSFETKALRCVALEAAWAAGPHPSQVRRRRWESRGPLLWMLAEHGYRPLQLRAQAIAAAAAGAPLPVVQYSPKQDVFRSEGLVRYIVAFL